MSATAIIPEEYVLMGPMWQKLPNELVWEICLYALMLGKPYCTPGRIYDKKRFDIINRLARLNKIRSIGGRSFAVQCMQLIYLNNDFIFKAFHVINHQAEHGLSLPPPLPPVHYRHYLRRMQIHLVLEDHYFTPPGDFKRRRFESPEQLLSLSPGAKLLKNLTSANKGFPKLELLDLHLEVEFFFNDEGGSFDLIKGAGFTVRARDVMISCWEGGVVGLIKVELTD